MQDHGFIDYGERDIYKVKREHEQWRIGRDKKRVKRTTSLINIPFKTNAGEYVFPSNKHYSITFNLDYGDFLEMKLGRIIRRKSCICNFCGGKQKVGPVIREVLKEPMYPFMKSKEEVSQEKSI